MRDRRRRRGRPLTAQHGRGAVGAGEDQRQVAAGPVEVRLDHLQRQAGGDGRVEGVATALQLAMPAAEASQWVEATMPKVPASSGRVVKFTRPTLAGACGR